MSVFEAVKSGSLEAVQAVVAKEGVDSLLTRDEKGHTPAHWACLGAHTSILRYIIDHKIPVNEGSTDYLGAKPIHWASGQGHIAVVDVLMQAGVSVDTTDNKGFTPLIVACQYRQTTLVGYLLGKGVRLQLTDHDGDTALHWAAFKGHSELLPLLMYCGIAPGQKDQHGQTALHLACISGDLPTVKELCRQGVALDTVDNNGKTPLMLAIGRKHDTVVRYLKKTAQIRTNFLPKVNFWTIVFGPSGNSKGPLLFFVVCSWLWGYPMYIFRGLPETYTEMLPLHVVYILCNVVMWVALYHANSVNPGYLPRNIPEYDQAIRQVAQCAEWKQGVSPISRLCHTCRTIKPLRAKHCRYCNRCVLEFDHHCPYIYNCVGYHNRVSFFLFSCAVAVVGMMSMYMSYHVMEKEGFPLRPDYLCGVALFLFFEAIAGFVVMSTLYQALKNITTNERVNKKRYSYLKDSEGRFHNPFDKGVLRNLLEYLHLAKGTEAEDVHDMGGMNTTSQLTLYQSLI
ncbi:uncharacterized protein LOC143299023 [Babylonia areolata]|uniref:uncharacterized protein LOC143299023 n=1 Tax=Babylonia areolata TaxID=304850 RepID=UPI003FD03D99